MAMNETIPEIPVLIVGAGAAGIVATAELRRRGIESRTIDSLPVAQNYSKALVVHARTLEMFERIDQSLVDKFLARGHPTKGFKFFFKGIDEHPELDFQELETRYPYVLNHRQDESEQWVREYLKEELNYEVEWNTRLDELKVEPNGVVAKLVHTDEDDRVETVRARWLIGSDGLNSLVRNTLDLEYEGDDYTGMVLQNMDVELTNFPEGLDDWLNFFIGKDHFILIARIPGGHFRLLISDMGEAANPGVTPKQAFQAYVDAHLENVVLGDPIWASKWEIWTRLAGTYQNGPVFLMGDSAHVHSPSGGQGMNCAMQDAHNLAWKLALVVQERAPVALLDTYETERRPIAGQVIDGASAIHEIIMGHGVDVESRFKMAESVEWLQQAGGRLSGISYTYRDYIDQPGDLSAVVGPMIGDRAPDARLVDTSLFAIFRHPDLDLVLIPKSASEIELCLQIRQKITARFDGVIRSALILAEEHACEAEPFVWRDAAGAISQGYGQSDVGRLYLIRPDGYIGYRCVLSDCEKFYSFVDSYLVDSYQGIRCVP